MTATMPKPNCYVASPYGFAESTRNWYNETLLPTLRKYVTPLDPWSVSIDHILKAPADEKPSLWTDLGDYHYNTIRDKARLVVAGLDQEPPDNGTVCEVAWAAAHEIPIIGYRNDVRKTGEEGMRYNLMIAAAIRRSGGVAVANMDELEQTVAQFASRIATA